MLRREVYFGGEHKLFDCELDNEIDDTLEN